jgi:hypothetical protein
MKYFLTFSSRNLVVTQGKISPSEEKYSPMMTCFQRENW